MLQEHHSTGRLSPLPLATIPCPPLQNPRGCGPQSVIFPSLAHKRRSAGNRNNRHPLASPQALGTPCLRGAECVSALAVWHTANAHAQAH